MRHPTRLATRLSIVVFAFVGMSSVGIARPTTKTQSGKLEDPPWIKEVATQRIVYTVPGMERIKARKDLTYKRFADAELKMDVYNPRNLPRGARRPAIVFIHGGAGGWMALPTDFRPGQTTTVNGKW